MSQQMDFGEMHHEGPPYGRYEGAPRERGYTASPYGQKLPGYPAGRAASAGQRLALAIISLILLVFVTFGVIGLAMVSNAGFIVVVPILLVLTLFYTAVIIINIVFNRRG